MRFTEELIGWLLIILVVTACIFLHGCQATQVVVQWKCPVLADPPTSVVDTLEATGKKDPSAAAWTVDLDKHYTKCDIINKQGKP